MTADRELRLGETLGWRAWQVIGEERLPILASVSHSSTVWHANRWTFATCDGLLCRRSSDGRVPGESCSCGLYAARDRAHLVRLGYAEGGDDEDQPVFVGQVGFAGKVIPGDQGWRAEKGRIVRLYVPYLSWRFVEGIERLYNVPVEMSMTTTVEGRTWGFDDL